MAGAFCVLGHMSSFFQKSFVIALGPTLLMEFNIISHNCWVLQYLKEDQLSGCWIQGQGNCCYFLKNNCHRSSAYIYQWILI